MTVDGILSRLDGVRCCGPGKWQALCPAHDDRRPSLSVREGESAILIRCWAGCSLWAICETLAIKVGDLFYNAEGWRLDRKAMERRHREKKRQEAVEHLKGLRIDTVREAERLLQCARGRDISAWSPDQLDAALNAVSDALEVLREEGELYARP